MAAFNGYLSHYQRAIPIFFYHIKPCFPQGESINRQAQAFRQQLQHQLQEAEQEAEQVTEEKKKKLQADFMRLSIQWLGRSQGVMGIYIPY